MSGRLHSLYYMYIRKAIGQRRQLYTLTLQLLPFRALMLFMYSTCKERVL